MRRNAPTGLDALDLETREAAEAAARRSGMTLEEWVAATVMDQAGSRTAAKKPRRRPGDELETAIAKMAKVTRQRQSSDFEAIIAAAAAESERHARDNSARTAVALESVASWIEQAEERLNEASRTAADRQDHLASALSEALGAIKDRLDAVERRVATERAASGPEPRRPAEPPVSPAIAEAFASLRADMATLISRVEVPREAPWPPVIDDIQAELGRLRAAVGNLASGDDVAGLESLVRRLADDLSKASSNTEIQALAGTVTGLQRQIRDVAKEIEQGVRERLSAEMERLASRIEKLAAKGVDGAVIESLRQEQASMRQALAQVADPQRLERLSEEVAALGRLMAEMRLNQVGRSDFAVLKNALEDIRASLKKSEEERSASPLPAQLQSLTKQVQQLASRPEPADLAPVFHQLGAMTERLAALGADRPNRSEMVKGLERLSDRVTEVSERVAEVSEQLVSPSREVIDRLDRIEDGLRHAGQNSDTAQIELMLRSVQDRLERAPMSRGSLEGLEHQIEALTARLQDMGPVGPLQAAVEETLIHVKSLRDEAGRIAERAVKAAIDEMKNAAVPPATLDMDAVKQGFAELKALQASADKKTQQTLKAVHNALETLVFRGPPAPNASWPSSESSRAAPDPGGDSQPAVRLEAAVRKLHAAAISHVEEVTSSSLESVPQAPEAAQAEEVLLEPGTPRSGPAITPAASFTASHDAEPAHVRASFIAAARRAAQAALGDKDTAPPQVNRQAEGEELDASGRAISNQTLIERIRQTFDIHRRPLLLSLALLILAAGTIQIASTHRPDDSSAELSPIVGEQIASAIPAPAAEPVVAPAGQEVEAPDTTGTLADPSALLASPGPSASFAKRIENLDSTKDLPAGLPATLKEAALSGDPAALYEVATRVAEGRQIPQDPALAARLFAKVAETGLAPAQYRLGNLYEKGFGVPRDAVLAKDWYERAAKNGNARAMHNLGVLLAEGVEGKPDYSAARQWFLEAAEHGVKDSQYNLGVLLARGLGVGQDLAQSYKWFALAAAQGDQDAAKKQEEVGARLTPDDLRSAKASVGAWQVRVGNPWANDVPPPPQGWTALRKIPGQG